MSKWTAFSHSMTLYISYIVTVILSCCAVVSFNGIMPVEDLDFGWRFGVAEAAAAHIPFGDRIVFTFGPLSFLYSQFVVPSQRMLYLTVGCVIVAIFVVSIMAVSRRWTLAILLLPLALANAILLDGFFLVLPLPLVLLAASTGLSSRTRTAAMLALSGALGFLPIVKGTMTIPVAGCVGLAAALLMIRGKVLKGASVIGAPIAVMVGTWVALGQPVRALPTYFLRQTYIVLGYTDAMSLFGDIWQVVAYLVCAVVLIAVVAQRRRLEDLVAALALACILFVAFKAGFVRHDGHAMISSGVLLLSSLILLLQQSDIARIGAAAASIAAWVYITGAYVPVDPRTDFDRLKSTVTNSGSAIAELLQSGDTFTSRFAQAERKICEAARLPSPKGPSDVYTVRQVELLACKLAYNPRPVLQSYSAYTSELAAINREHIVSGAAPTTIYFAPEAIDGHYPSLDDGLSWPDLLARYSFRQFSESFAVLDRSFSSGAAVLEGPYFDRNVVFNSKVFLPPPRGLIWARLNFRQTFLSRAVAFAWKRPILWIDVNYLDGHSRRFRLIPGMASAGFLLSPTVETAHQFVALRTPDGGATPASGVKSFSIAQDGNLWGNDVHVTLAALKLPPDLGVRGGSIVADPPLATMKKGGDCSIDMVGANVSVGLPMVAAGRYVNVTGWGYAQAAKGAPSRELHLVVSDANGLQRSFRVERHARPDVDAHFGIHNPMQAGYTAVLDLGSMKAPYTLRIVQGFGGEKHLCPNASVLIKGP